MGISYKSAALLLLCLWVSTTGFLTAQTSTSLDLFNATPLHASGQNVIPLFDGWFPNADGTFTLCFGYFNMNTEESLDVPLGEANKLEPALYDGVQPTHFDPVPNPTLTRLFRHHWCVFSIIVPEDFGDSEILWTLETQGNKLEVPGWLLPAYILDEEFTTGRNTVAPYLSLNDDPPNFRGRKGLWEGPRIAKVGEPLALIARIVHPESGTWLGWTLHQGPGPVEFSPAELRMDVANGTVTTTATFDQAGSYVLRVQAINDTERQGNPTYGFEFYCCWTNGYVRVDVVE